jgi:predicted Ser/Thr protein kinase
MVGGYRLLRQIGEGGMGVVHLAEPPDGEEVAVKVLRPNVVGDEESRRRLAQEVESLQHVRSDHVAEIVDADPRGPVPFVVTRFVAGESLHAVVEHDGPLEGGELLRTAHGLLLAVRDVHAAQVLHRDLKPTNVVMEGASPILIDFGLARLAEDPRLTATGWLMGSPGYLAPEVLLGHPATTATDVHGWAATIVHAATGHSPYGRGHTMAVLDRTRRGELDLDGVPADLVPVLSAALHVDPRRRPSVDQLLRVVEGWGGRPTGPTTGPTAGPTTRAYTVLAPAGSSLPPAPAGGGWAAFRRFLGGLVLAAAVVSCVAAAPYLTAAVLAAGVVLLRGLSRSRESVRERRAVRGRRWFDAPLGVLGYPWHVVRGSLGAAALLLFAGGLAAATASAAVLADLPADRALLCAGAVLTLGIWWGPGSARVREPVGGLLAGAARHAGRWWLLVAVLVAAGGAAWWTSTDHGVTWTPAASAPWPAVRDLARDLGIDPRP